MGAMDVSTLQSSELDAKRRLVRLQRQLLAARVAHSVQVTRDNNLAKAATARAEMDQLLSRDMAAAMSSEPPATEEQVVWLASVLHEKMHQLFSVVNNGVPTKVSWFRLFKHMDDDESGLISYTELADMVRNELNMSTHQLPEKTLKTVWLALDQDGSGRLTAGEFGAFMRLGEKPKERVNPLGGKTEDLAGWRERTMLANKRQSFAAKAEMDKLLDKGIAQSGIAKASQEEVKQLAARLHEKMHQLFAVVHNGVPSKVSWYRLFKHMDDDESGLISFVEFADMVRNELRLDDKELPEKQLKAAWLALDDDGSGRLTAGEFGAFMRIGVKEKGRVQEARARAAEAKPRTPRRHAEGRARPGARAGAAPTRHAWSPRGVSRAFAFAWDGPSDAWQAATVRGEGGSGAGGTLAEVRVGGLPISSISVDAPSTPPKRPVGPSTVTAAAAFSSSSSSSAPSSPPSRRPPPEDVLARTAALVASTSPPGADRHHHHRGDGLLRTSRELASTSPRSASSPRPARTGAVHQARGRLFED